MTGAAASPGKDANDRLGRLDGLRGLAACVVAFGYHAQLLLAPEDLAASDPVTGWFFRWGWTFVDLFFLISGYIFAHVYLTGERLRRPGALGAFAVARLARLYPLHLLMLLVCAALFADEPANTALAFVAHLFMLQAFVTPAGHTFDGPAWSLSVEVVCYVLFAAGAAGGERSLRRMAVAALAVGLGALAWLGQPGGPWVSDMLPRGLLGFFTGLLLWRGRERLARVPAWTLLAALLAALALPTGAWSPLLPLALVAWPAALLLALRWRALESSAMRWLGDRSYAIYLVHLPLLAWGVGEFGPYAGLPRPAVIGGFAALVLVLAELSFRFVERPARAAIRAAWGKRRGAPTAVAASG